MLQKYNYLRAIFVGLPFGIASLFMGINKFNTIPDSVKDFNTYTGEIRSFGMKKIYDKELKGSYERFYVAFDDSEFYTELGKEQDVLRKNLPKMLKKTKLVKVWFKNDRKYIEQLSVGEEMLIEYSPPYWIAHFFFWLGVITVVSGGIYVVKHPEDLFG